MNRKERRAVECENRRNTERETKQSHKLPHEVCTLYVPSARGYVAEFTDTSFRVVESIEFARLYVDDDASGAALTFRERTGLRVSVRPFHPQALQ